MIPKVNYTDIEKVYGNPIKNGDLSKLQWVRLPFPLRLSWRKDYEIVSTYVHPVIAKPFVAALTTILNYYGPSYLRAHDLDLFGGCHNNRPVAGGGRLSVHAWGLAVDYVPHLGALGVPSTVPHVIVKAFEDVGFHWGGWFTRKDGMHFSGINEWR